MFIKAIFTYLTVVIIGSVTAWIELDFDSCSTYTINELNEDKSYLITWQGESISTPHCKIGFNPYNSKYKVCITASSWDIQDEGVTLNYYSTLDDVPEKTYSYDSSDTPTIEWCSDPSENIDIELLTSTSSDYQSSFVLEVTGVKTYDYNTFQWTVGGALGGGVVLLFALILIFTISYRRRRASQGIPVIIVTPRSQLMRGECAVPGYGTVGKFQGPPSYEAVTNNSYPAPVHKVYQPQQSYQQ